MTTTYDFTKLMVFCNVQHLIIKIKTVVSSWKSRIDNAIEFDIFWILLNSSMISQ